MKVERLNKGETYQFCYGDGYVYLQEFGEEMRIERQSEEGE